MLHIDIKQNVSFYVKYREGILNTQTHTHTRTPPRQQNQQVSKMNRKLKDNPELRTAKH